MVERGKFRFSILLLLILVGVLGFANAETLTVGEGQTYTTIQGAITAAGNEGDIIEVYSGTYNENLNVNRNNLTVKAVEGQHPIIQSSINQWLIKINAENVIIEGFELIGSRNTNWGIRTEKDNATIKNNKIKNVITGIQTTSVPIGKNKILGNNISNAQVGISLQNGYNIVEENVLTGISGEGIGLGNGPTGNDVIENNKLSNISGVNIKDYNSGLDFLEIAEKNNFEKLIIIQNSIGKFQSDALYVSIQDAIDDAEEGSIVYVSPGLYNERITINKSITLRGATYNVNKNGYSVPAGYNWDTSVESIITNPEPNGTIIYIKDTSDVTIEGFVVQALNREKNNINHLIHIDIDEGIEENINILNNILGPNTNTDSQDGTKGRMNLNIDIGNSGSATRGLENSLVKGNKIFGAEGDGINLFIIGLYSNYAQHSSLMGTIIEDNEIYGSHRTGIETAGGISGLTIRNNKIYDNKGNPSEGENLKYGHGILMVRGSSDSGENIGLGPENITIEDNQIYGNEKSGIYFGPVNKDYNIKNNEIYRNGFDGIRLDMEAHFKNPTFEEEDRVGFFDKSENVKINSNKIYNNGQKGINLIGTPTNGFILNAQNNYWGTNDGSVIATKVSDNVDYTPWITQSSGEVTTEENVPKEINTEGTNASITLTTSTSQTGTVTVQQFSEDPHGGFSVGGKNSLGKYIEIDSEIANENIASAEIRIYYTDDELAASGIAESSMKLYWYNETSARWEVIANSGVNVTGNYVWGITNHFSTYTLGGAGGPDVMITSLVCLTGYTNNPKNIFSGYAYDASNLVTQILYNRSDQPISKNPEYDTAQNLNNVSFHTDPYDPVFPEGNNSIFIWALSNQTGPTTVCEFFVDTQAPNKVENVVQLNTSLCVPEYVNFAPNFKWDETQDNFGGSGIDYYEIELFDNSVSAGLFNESNLNFTVSSPINNHSYYIRVRAWDNANNYGEWSDYSPTVFYDNENPSVAINSPPQGTYFKNNFSIIEIDSDNLGLSSCKYRITNNANPTLGYTEVECNSPLIIDIFSYCTNDGTCRIYKNVTDNACNTNELSRYFYIDRTAPLLSILSPINYFNSSDINLDVNYSVNDLGVAGVSCWYSDNNLANVSLSGCANITSKVWNEGNHNVSIYANDSLGNLNSTSVYFTIDTTAPSMTINSPENKTYATDEIVFNITATDLRQVDSCVYSLDGNSNESLTNSGNYWTATNSSMTNNSHTVIFYCNDSLGNMNSSSRNFRVDTDAPIISMIHHPDNDGTTITESISRCDQLITAEILPDVSGINESSVYAELKNSTHEVVKKISLIKAINQNGTAGGTIFYGTMDMQIPVGTYDLVIYSSDNLGNNGGKTFAENIVEGIYVEYIDPVSCSISAGQSKTCQFTFNTCARNITKIDFNMTGLGENPVLVIPAELNATINKNNNFAYVGEHGVSEGNPRYLNLSNGEKINGKTTFNLSMTFTTNVTSRLGSGDYDLNYSVNGYNL